MRFFWQIDFPQTIDQEVSTLVRHVLVFCHLMTRDTQRLLDSASVLVDIPTQPPRFAHFDRCICELCFIANAKVRNRKNTTWQLAPSLPRYKITVAGCILRILPICLA